MSKVIVRFALLSLAALFWITNWVTPGTAAEGYNPPGMERPNGEMVIYFLEGEQWVEAGSLPFDKYLRERTKDLGGVLPASGPVKIRLAQRGGGAAHLDSVFLGGTPPLKVNGGGGLPLDKLLETDNDIINMEPGGIELEFPAAGQGVSLAVTARIEGLVISKVPFQFPLSNLYGRMDEHADFYRYRLDSSRGGIAVDQNISEVAGRDPFFTEYVYPASGHPPGYIYGWVMNDDENLYVALDFTPDNTMDGDKDYSKVYVKTTGGMKEFKVSVPENRWGRPGFTYTDKVGYQHKVYEFAIPLEEVGISGNNAGGEILLAFSAYGTASPGNYVPSLGYSQNHNSYLAAFQSTTLSRIGGQLIDQDGSPSGGEFVVSNAYGDDPSVAQGIYGGDHVYLVAWQSSGDVYGKLLYASNGAAVGNVFAITDGAASAGTGPAVAYDAGSQMYLVVWEDARGPTSDIYAQRLNADGSLNGGNFCVSNASNTQQFPSVASDGSGRFLVTWEDYRDNATPVVGVNIYARLVKTDGTFDGGDFSVSGAAADQRSPTVACDSSGQKFLVAWEDYRSGLSWDIYAQLVNLNGTLNGGNFAVSNAPGDQEDPSAAFDTASGRFLAAWVDSRNDQSEIYVQLVEDDGTLTGNNFTAFSDDEDQYEPSAANNSNHSQFMVAFRTEDENNDIVIAFSNRVYAIDSEAVAADKAALTFDVIGNNNPAPDNVSTDLSLIAAGRYGSTITWASSDEDIIAPDGSVTQPAAPPDQSVTLTATITRGSASDTKVFNITVIAPVAGGTTEVVSLKGADVQGNNYSLYVSASQDGRYVAFTSYAFNLVAGDTNSQSDIFVRDRQTGQTVRVSVSTGGLQANGYISQISGNGRYVAFSSSSSNLVTGDNNGVDDIFVRDRDTDGNEVFDEPGGVSTVRVSVYGDGTQGNSESQYPAISGDGRYVAFRSAASNLVSGDTNGEPDIFVRDRDTDGDGEFDEPCWVSTVRVSVAGDGTQGNGASFFPVISSNGRYVAFSTGSTNLVPGVSDFGVFIRDIQENSTSWVGVPNSMSASINADGRYVAFSAADGTVAGDNNGYDDVFVLDRDTAVVTRVSRSYSGQPDNNCYEPEISGDGRFVTYYSTARNIVRGDGNGTDDVFVFDRVTGKTQRASLSAEGIEGNDYSVEPAISGDGQLILFRSGADNLVLGDTNGQCDIFARTMLPWVLSDAEAVAADKAALTFETIKGSNTSENNITSNLSLPFSGSRETDITWSSSPGYISNAGVVTRPEAAQGDQTVTLTATISKNAESDTKAFNLLVKAEPFLGMTDAEAVAADKAALTLENIKGINISENNITTNLSLPSSGSSGTDITWSSSSPGYISNAGVVTRPEAAQGDQAAAMTATISRGGASDTKTFDLIVKALSGGGDGASIVVTPPPPPSPPGAIRGTVTGVDKARGAIVPLAGIRVILFPASGSGDARETVTGADGSYLIGGLSPGSYRVTFSATSGNYLTEWFNNRRMMGEADVIAVGEGEEFTADAVMDWPLPRPRPRVVDMNPQGDGERYTVTIPAKAVVDMDGNSLPENYVVTFSTGPGAGSEE